jgi:hypothetical protein
MKALLTSAPDPGAIARRLEMPVIAHATLAADSATWLAGRPELQPVQGAEPQAPRD